MNARLKKVGICSAVFIVLVLLFCFVPLNPNALLVRPLLADREPVSADLGIVLGAGLRYDGSLSDVANERVAYAVSLHKKTQLPLVFSGGETPYGIEAVEMNKVAKAEGYTGLDHIEASSHSTYENATFTRDLLDAGRFPDDTLLVITSPYHSRRALATFRKVMPNRRIAVSYPDTSAVLNDSALGRLKGLYNITREYAANLWYLAVYRVQPSMQPTQFVKGERLDFRMQDGIRVQGDYYAGATNKAVILLHMFHRDRHVWDDIIPSLQEKGWQVLNVDLRGHGGSEGNVDVFTDKQFQQMPIDVIALATWLKQNHGPVKVVAMGASIGSNAAINAAALSDQIDAVIALSPGENYHGIETFAAAKKVRVPTLYVTALDDGQSAVAFPTLLENTATRKNEKTLIEYEIGGHGTALFESQPDLLPRITAFIDSL